MNVRVWGILTVCVAVLLLTPRFAAAQAVAESSAGIAEPTITGFDSPLSPITIDNPLDVVSDAADALPFFVGGVIPSIYFHSRLSVPPPSPC